MSTRRFRIACIVAAAFVLLSATHSHAQIFTTLLTFNSSNGANPLGNLTVSGSTLYGTTDSGGGGYGTVFSISATGGSITQLLSFNGTNGQFPEGSLLLSGSKIYGVTYEGGVPNDGTIFSLPVTGSSNPTTLFSFSGSNGFSPDGGLVLSGSTLYGAAYQGGSQNDGTIFSLPVTGGTATTLLSFSGTSGANPAAFPNGNLMLSGSTLYGTTASGGSSNLGTVFSVPLTGGTVTILGSFNGNNGNDPQAGLVLSGSMLYGTTNQGGANGIGTVFSIPVTGGVPTALLSFSGTSGANPGASPEGGLVLSGSRLYGTTALGGTANAGEIFSVPVSGGSATALVSFNGNNGSRPTSGLALGGSTLYGTTYYGGTDNAGVIFSLNVAPATIGLSGFLNATIITGGTAAFPSTLSNASSAGYSLNYTLSSSVSSGTAHLGLISPTSGTLSPGGTQSLTLSATSSTLGTNVIAITASDPNSSNGSLIESASLTVLGHAVPGLAVANNQFMIVGATGVTASLSLSNGTSGQSGLASLDVNSLGAGVSGGTGGQLVASGLARSYTGAISSGTLGTQHAAFSMNVGDDHTLSGASSPLNISTTATWTVLGHAAPGLAVASGNNQVAVVGATGVTAGLTLSNGSANQTGIAALDVNSLSGATGLTGNKLVAAGTSQGYVAALSTSALGLQNESVSVNAGDDHTLPGAAAAANISTSVSLIVLDHANASLSSSAAQAAQTINFGNVLKGATSPNQSFTVCNLAANTSAFYTSNLKLVSYSTSGDSALTTNLASFNGLSAGNGNTFTASLNTANNTTGVGAKTITMAVSQLVDDNSYPGAGNNNNGALTVTLVGNVGNATADASGVTTRFGPVLTAQVASSGSYANLQSTVQATSGTGGGAAQGSTATILAGSNAAASSQTVGMQWRTRASSDPAMASDIVDLSGMAFSGSSGQASPFVMQMTYDAAIFGDASAEELAAASGQIGLDWYDPANGLWENAIDGNFGQNVGTFHLGTWPSGDMTLGDWGVNTANDTVWAIVNHNSEFAVVPEPRTLWLLFTGVLCLLGFVWRRRRLIAPGVVVLAALLASERSFAQVQYRVTDLGTLSGGTNSTAYAINDNGVIVGGSTTNQTWYDEAFVYSGGTMHDMGFGTTYSQALAINNSGQIVGAYQVGSYMQPYVYSGGTMQRLSTLGSYGGWAYAINDLGQIAGESINSNDTANHAVLYSGGTLNDLGTLGPGSSIAAGINNLGQIVGYAYPANRSATWHAFYDSAGTMTDLGTLSGGTNSHANAINDVGEIVGQSSLTGGANHAFADGDSGPMLDLGTLGGGNSEAMDVNNLGQIVGWSATSGTIPHAFLDEDGFMDDLNVLIPPTSGWTLEQANGINNEGQIVGYGISPSGQPHAFLLTPTPEPSTLALLAAGALGLCAYGWRRRRLAKRATRATEDDAPAALAFPLRQQALRRAA